MQPHGYYNVSPDFVHAIHYLLAPPDELVVRALAVQHVLTILTIFPQGS